MPAEDRDKPILQRRAILWLMLAAAILAIVVEVTELKDGLEGRHYIRILLWSMMTIVAGWRLYAGRRE